MQQGVRRVFAYGPVQKDSIFEIRSITKTFTGLILAQMVVQEIRFDNPMRTLLPAGVVTKPDGAEITLLDSTTPHSGLSLNLDNLHPADQANLFRWLRIAGSVRLPPQARSRALTGDCLRLQQHGSQIVRAGALTPCWPALS